MDPTEKLTIPAADILAKTFAQGRMSPLPIHIDGQRQLILKPRDVEVHIIDPVNKSEPDLKRITSKVKVLDEASFVAYVKRYQSDKTQIFATPGFANSGMAQMVASIDYHLKDSPQRCEHFVHYLPRYSEQWARWHKVCQGTLKQVEFAELIEECARDIAEPSASALLNIVRTFKAAKKTDFDSVVYQSNGGVTLNYSEQVEQKGQSGALPEKLKLGIPVYFRGTAYAVDVLIRYRVGNGGVVFDLKLDRADVIEDEAFSEILASIAEHTGIVPYLGTAS